MDRHLYLNRTAPRRRCRGVPRAGFQPATPLIGNSAQLELPGLLPRPPHGLPMRRPRFPAASIPRGVVYQFQRDAREWGLAPEAGGSARFAGSLGFRDDAFGACAGFGGSRADHGGTFCGLSGGG
jgi:hypothetical protein